MYPLHTGSVLLDIANAQRTELLAAPMTAVAPPGAPVHHEARPSRASKQPWWSGLARSHRAA